MLWGLGKAFKFAFPPYLTIVTPPYEFICAWVGTSGPCAPPSAAALRAWAEGACPLTRLRVMGRRPGDFLEALASDGPGGDLRIYCLRSQPVYTGLYPPPPHKERWGVGCCNAHGVT